MIYLLLLATFAASWAEEVTSELKPAESAPIRVQEHGDHEDERRYRFEDGLELIRYRDNAYRSHLERDHDDHRSSPRPLVNTDHQNGPYILRSIDPHHNEHPDIERQNKIIAHVFSPDYYQPTWILDYRYQKTGGRDYTRGPGGQILILPKNVRTNEHKDFQDFDQLLEHLRLTRIAEEAERAKIYEREGHENDDRRRDGQEGRDGYHRHRHGQFEYNSHGLRAHEHAYDGPGRGRSTTAPPRAHVPIPQSRRVQGKDVHGQNAYEFPHNPYDGRQYLHPYQSSADRLEDEHRHH